MIVEGRKRDAAANALLALSFAANAAQSPQALVRSGHIEGPGIQLMSRMMTKRKEADRNLDSGRVSHPARNRKKKTFKEFVEEIELLESSSGERGTRRLPSRGPSSDRFERNKQRNVSSSNAALKKAGFKRSTKYMSGTKGRPTKWTETSTSSHHGTETGTYANQSDYAARATIKRGATSTRVSKLKRIRAQLGGDRTSRPVHDVAVVKKRTFNDTPSSTMTRGRSFRQEVTKGVPDNLKKAGAKAGDIVTSTPTSGSRSRMYGKTHNTKTDSRTGMTVNRVRKESVEEAYLTEKTKTFSSREEGEKHHGGTPKGYYWNNAGSTENPRWRLKPKSGGAKERQARKERIQSLSTPEDREKAKRKENVIKRKGYEVHHITPTHQSAKLRASMSDAEWKKRVERDKKIGIYHGHHPRNLMAAKGKNTPEGKPGIPHRAGGAHEFEGKTKDIVSGPGSKESAITNRDLISAAVKKRSRERRQAQNKK